MKIQQYAIVLCAAAALAGCGAASPIGLVDVQRIVANWPEYQGYQNQLYSEERTLAGRRESAANRQRETLALQRKYSKVTDQLSQQIKDAAGKIASQRQLKLVLTREGIGYGGVDITSDVGIGTKMTITLPITLAIINVLLVEIGARLFAMPLASVEEAIALDQSQVRTIEGREVLTVRGASLPICRLARMFGVPQRARARPRAFVVIAQVGNRRLGFVVDELVGQQDIVIKALGKSLAKVRGFAGATELGDQRVALVLDVAALIEEVLAPGETRFLATTAEGGRA